MEPFGLARWVQGSESRGRGQGGCWVSTTQEGVQREAATQTESRGTLPHRMQPPLKSVEQASVVDGSASVVRTLNVCSLASAAARAHLQPISACYVRGGHQLHKNTPRAVDPAEVLAIREVLELSARVREGG